MDLPGQVLREAHLVQIGVQATVVERVFSSSIPPSWLRGSRNAVLGTRRNGHVEGTAARNITGKKYFAVPLFSLTFDHSLLV